jgi:hypothetical protein
MLFSRESLSAALDRFGRWKRQRKSYPSQTYSVPSSPHVGTGPVSIWTPAGAAHVAWYARAHFFDEH